MTGVQTCALPILDKDIRAYLEAENVYQNKHMAGTVKLQEQLFEEMKGRIKEDDSSVPVKDGPYGYGVSYVTGGQHPHFFRIPRNGGEETVYLNGDDLARNKEYFNLGTVQHSPDHSKFAWSYDEKGSEFYTIKIRNFGATSDTSDEIDNTSGDVVWDAKSEGFFYTKMDEKDRKSVV